MSEELFRKPVTAAEDKWSQLLNGTVGNPDVDEKAVLLELLDDEVLWEKRNQRQEDCDYDHPIALFTRQKKQSTKRIVTVLVLLTLTHLVQIGAMYNLSFLSFTIPSNVVSKQVEVGNWVAPANPELLAANASIRYEKVTAFLNGSEVDLAELMARGVFCLSEAGYFETVFNIVTGLIIVFMFIFSDLWRVIFDTTITRSYPGDPHIKLVLGGALWLVLLNALIVTWLGVDIGFRIVANAGEFTKVLENSLANYVILRIDDAVLPLIRFLIEENGHLGHDGYLERERLDVLTHGTQYYRPGYGETWMQTIKTAPSMLQRAIAVVLVPVALSLVVAPVGVVTWTAFQSYIPC